MKHYYLMIPGPIELDPEILAEMSTPLVAHYGPEWVKYHNETVQIVKQVFRTQKSDLFLMPGPGSLAIEAALSSLVSDGSKILVLNNGFFGERWLKVCQSYTQQVVTIEAPWGQAISPDAVSKVLKREKNVRAAIVVHGETSTGVTNPVREIGQICHQNGVISIVDAVSTLGGVPLEVDEWHIDICATATQKCLECPPGLAPISVSPEAWKQVEQTSSPGWYMNLRTWKEYTIRWGDWHPHPVTMPTGLTRALRFSCERILAEGLNERYQRHARMANLLRQGLYNLGFDLLVENEHCRSNTFTAVRADARISAPQLIKYLKDHHQIQIAGGLDRLAGQIFRLGHMGPTATVHAIVPTLVAIEEALRASGAKVEAGQSLRGMEIPTSLSHI